MRNNISEMIEHYAEQIYLQDSTGENFIENIIHSSNLPRLLGYIPEDALSHPILEMGFGEGTITEPLVHAGLKVEIIEGSSKLCDSARQKFGSAVQVYCDYFENFVPDKLYRTVLALHVLEHVDDPVVVLRAVLKWLSPGGQVIAVVPNAESYHRKLAVMMGLQEKLDSLSPRDLVVGHQRVMTMAQLKNAFSEAGFDVVNTFGYFLKVVPNSMMTAWPRDLIRALTAISDELPAEAAANIGLIARRPE